MFNENINVTVRFGSENINHNVRNGSTVGEVVNSREVRMQLGYGDNVRVLIAGVEQSMSAIAPDGATLVVETRANTKAN